jgi:hypothetical protein
LSVKVVHVRVRVPVVSVSLSVSVSLFLSLSCPCQCSVSIRDPVSFIICLMSSVSSPWCILTDFFFQRINFQRLIIATEIRNQQVTFEVTFYR